jgi:indolepyruvate ferredoxin oxidoreductase alpha subunit
MADGGIGKQVFIPDIVRACGVDFIRECDPYDMETFISCLKEADRYSRSPEGGIAVIISKHPCLLDRKAGHVQPVSTVRVTDDCIGCQECIDNFECPAIMYDPELERVRIDEILCIGCGVCRHVCPVGAITVESN